MIELVIVVVIIGILAAIAMPALTRASERSRLSALRFETAQLQSAVERYTAEHDGLSPAHDRSVVVDASSDAFLARLLQRTGPDGVVDQTAGLLGPYLSKAPANPLSTCQAARIGGSSAAAGCAFWFDPDHNNVRADHASFEADCVFHGK